MNSFKIIKKLAFNVYLARINDSEIVVTKSKFGSHYGERKIGQYREWLANRSKLAAIFLKGYSLNINPDWIVLYLGAASGTTVSHISDILERGYVYAVEVSPKPFLKLLELAKERENIIPILDDASKPWRYSGIVEKVDLVYQDIAQRDQVSIFIENTDMYLKKDGEGLIIVKARSIDSTVDPKIVFKNVINDLENKFRVLKYGSLEPFHKDHIFVHVLLDK